MGIDLGTQEEQKEMAQGPVPPGSYVKVKLEIRKPKKAIEGDPAVNEFKGGLLGLDCEFVIVSGTFEGCKIWENQWLPEAFQAVKLNDGQKKACNISGAKMRAVIESVRGIDPKDPAGDRNIESWFYFHGLQFPVKVGCNKPKSGDKYVNNNILKVLTVADEHYQHVMDGGEIISEAPIPELPTSTEQTETKTPPAQWSQNSPPLPDKAPNETTVSVPAWAAKK